MKFQEGVGLEKRGRDSQNPRVVEHCNKGSHVVKATSSRPELTTGQYAEKVYMRTHTPSKRN